MVFINFDLPSSGLKRRGESKIFEYLFFPPTLKCKFNTLNFPNLIRAWQKKSRGEKISHGPSFAAPFTVRHAFPVAFRYTHIYTELMSSATLHSHHIYSRAFITLMRIIRIVSRCTHYAARHSVINKKHTILDEGGWAATAMHCMAFNKACFFFHCYLMRVVGVGVGGFFDRSRFVKKVQFFYCSACGAVTRI